MNRPPSKYERMALRRAIGNRLLPEPPVAIRGADCLWPHACFQCRKSWKLSENSSAICPQCRTKLNWMGRAFKPPKKTDVEQWRKVEALWRAGFRFDFRTRRHEVEPYPERYSGVAEFIRRNPAHPFRVQV
jgi:hypothetical protein